MEQPDNEEKVLIILSAFSLFLAAIEFLFPKPIPFMRLGLANIPLLLALSLLSPQKYALLLFIKVLGQGLVNGTLLSYPFLLSLAGTVTSGTVMYLLFTLAPNLFSLVGLSLLGSFFSNIAQFTLVVLFIFKSYAWPILIPLLWIGLVSGLFIGLLCEQFIQKSTWYKNHLCLKRERLE